ncbi:MAG: septum formation family protein [Acidimicrobiales bacterium]
MWSEKLGMFSTRVLPIVVLLGLGAAACGSTATSDESTRNDAGDIVEAGDVGVLALGVGDCFDDPSEDATEVASVAAVPCDQPHDNQAYAVFDLPDGDWLGQDPVVDAAFTGCLDRFEAAIGEPYDVSPLDILPLYPTEDSWNAGDHEVVCAVYNVDLSKLTASVLA